MMTRDSQSRSANSKPGLLIWTSSLAMLCAAGVFGLAGTRTAHAAPASNLVMAANHTITGTVLDSDGKPSADAPVKLLLKGVNKVGPKPKDPNASPSGDSAIGTPPANDMGPGAVIERGERVVQAKRTDASGHYSFVAVPNGKFSVFAGVGTTAARVDVEIHDADLTAPDIKLNPKS